MSTEANSNSTNEDKISLFQRRLNRCSFSIGGPCTKCWHNKLQKNYTTQTTLNMTGPLQSDANCFTWILLLQCASPTKGTGTMPRETNYIDRGQDPNL